jgi:hypothetical protein
MRRPTKKLRRSLLVVGTSAALLSLGGANALAATNSSTQSASNNQLLPIGVGLGVSAPLNLNLPLLSGGNNGPVTQSSDSSSTSTAKNAEVNQSVRQQGSGDNTASQTSKNNQVAPIAISGSISAPINVNLPIGLLSPGANEGSVNQRSDSEASSRAVNAEHDQDIDQRGNGNADNDAQQVAINNQLLPIALGLGVSAPININAPIAILSPDANRGDVNQRTDSDAHAEALNNETEQEIRQNGGGNSSNSASQKAISNQLLPIAAGLAAAVPVNVNAPIAILSPGANNGDVDQMADADVYSDALNNDTNQSINQQGSGNGSNTAGQNASNTQLLPIALGAGLSLPVNARAPIAVLAPGSNDGDVRQKAEGDPTVVATNNRTNQDVRQRAGGGDTNTAMQDAVSQQLLPIAAALGVTVPANAVAPIALLDVDANEGDVNQHNETDLWADSINYDLNQSSQQGTGNNAQALSTQAASANDTATTAESAPGPVGASAPVQHAIPVAALGGAMEKLTSVLSNPLSILGVLKGFLGL